MKSSEWQLHLIARNWGGRSNKCDISSGSTRPIGGFAFHHDSLDGATRFRARMKLSRRVAFASPRVGFDRLFSQPHNVDPARVTGQLSVRGIPRHVTVFYISGNSRGQAFSEAFAKAFNRVGIYARAVGNLDDQGESKIKASPRLDRQSDGCAVVTVGCNGLSSMAASAASLKK
jgi:hypothetical protein